MIYIKYMKVFLKAEFQTAQDTGDDINKSKLWDTYVPRRDIRAHRLIDLHTNHPVPGGFEEAVHDRRPDFLLLERL